MAPQPATATVAKEPDSPFLVLERMLDDLAALLLDTPAEAYVAAPLPSVSGSIGGHVRHTLDHIAAFVGASPSAGLCYDRRERGTSIETDPSAALRAILRLKAALAGRPQETLEQPVQVASLIAASGESITGWSTLARELAFVVSHTVHHQAIIALLLAAQGLGAPDWFGYAPSTPRASRA
jgi:uncharacterized damage-inducible protein DinB